MSARGCSVFGMDDARLVQVDDYKIDINPRGHLLFFHNTDKPGVLARMLATLTEGGVNIAHLGLGRHVGGSDSLGVLILDAPLDAAVLARVRSLPHVSNVRAASISSMDVKPRVLAEHAPTGLDARLAAGLHVHMASQPSVRPSSPCFGSGPTRKRPGWSLAALSNAAVGRSHRSRLGRDKLRRAIDLTRDLLQLPPDFVCGIVPGSDTGAFEMAMWNLLGPHPVDSVYFDAFGSGWHTDITRQLMIQHVRAITAPFGRLPDLAQVDKSHDVVFTWNGTSSGVMV
ncbi:ACT domain-containing protein, partial [archaeon]